MKKLLALFQRKKKPRVVLDGWDDEDGDDSQVDRVASKKAHALQHVILYIRTADYQLWGYDKLGWRLLTEIPSGHHVIVMVNLAEESFHELNMPRIFGKDKAAFLQRQLDSRFPDTPYRIVLGASTKVGPLEYVSPKRQVLVGLESLPRVSKLIKEHNVTIKGIWTVSIMMAHYGRSLFLPEDLFIVFLGPGGQRIVYLKNRVPVLTRLTPNPYQAAAQVDEIIRTLRYLENKHIVERGTRRHSLLLLGDPTDLKDRLADARFDLVTRIGRDEAPPADWRFPLFERVIKSPSGQLAPIIQRTEYLADRINMFAKRIRIGSIVAVVLFLLTQIPAAQDIYSEIKDEEIKIQGIGSRIADVDKDTFKYGVTADLMRRAIDLDDKEIVAAPDFDKQLRTIANALSKSTDLRLKDFHWRIIPQGASPCKTESSTTPPPYDPTGNTNNIKVEVMMKLTFPESYGPKIRAAAVSNFSRELTQISGLTLKQDPAKEVGQESLEGGGTVSNAAIFPQWCLVLVPPKPATSPAS
jgi:hypothetical protein